jgi:D-tyrosyl-tRNA(Tyr) deacylase
VRALLRRVQHAKVSVDDSCISSIESGLLVYLGVCHDDGEDDMEWIVKKLLSARIFEDKAGLMNVPIPDSSGILLVSQFTLFGNMRKGTRPSFNHAAPGEFALEVFEKIYQKLCDQFTGQVAKGRFGADMQISALDDGPVTIWLDSQNKSY